MSGKQYDVLIIGGGLVGASLLCALESAIHQYGLKVALVETHSIDETEDSSPSSPPSSPPSYDARASALSYGARLIYDELGLWPDLEPFATPILDIQVSDRGHFGATHLNHQEENVPALGYVIENYRLGDVLLKRLKGYRDQGQVEVLSPAQVQSLKPLPDSETKVVIRQEDKTVEKLASLVVLADGGRSCLMAKLGISRKHYDYQQHALIANVSLDKPHKGIAYERFAGRGPMALLPLSEDRSALVWTLPSDQVDDKVSMDDERFLIRLQEEFGYRAGQFIKVGRRESYPLSLSVAREQVRPGLVVLGNAAHAMHPVAGQGYNLAIRDAMALAGNISESLRQGMAPGNLSRLLHYVEEQKSDQKMTLDFCDGLVKLFSRQELPVILARNLGLSCLDMNRRLKGRFARKAMGV
ncbi:2-octaprenyl-6-methoxyphenyl hydroxylase [Endozoicomonas sp. 4G]|uniref:2-octaprenyl-6-methoxyphenyl hydroxylase n=1 Tax=Endozoicomonas sp. 4G TaxID=2872754 RepID=UPI002078C2F6|nr:2-octaprenyl-6-methoxyphenyl hydroxylase [Endozoicomonas sp. 4G]